LPRTTEPTEPYPAAVLDLLGAAGNRTVFEHGSRTVSGTAMLGMVRRIAAGLRTERLGPGDGIAMLLGVTPEAFAAIIAGHVVGARVVGVRPGLSDGQLRHLLGQDVAATVTDADPPPHAPRPLPVADLLAASDDGVPPRLAGRPNDVARLIHTSGSTGNPKACAQTYAAMAAAWVAHPDAWPPAVRELASRMARYLVFGTLASQVMMEYGILTLAAGGTMVVADPPAFPDAITRLRATASVITVPRLYQLVARQRTEPADLSSLRALLVSGSPLPAARHREALDVLGPVLFHGYGQTETGMISMATPADLPGTVGVPPDAVDLEVRDPAGAPVESGVDGELFVRTPAQGNGYWADPTESATVFTDGWVRTRDIGHLDEAGRLHLVGRARDVVIVNANLYYTGPIEQVLASHPDVAEAYVVGAPDEDTGEAVHAFVVPAFGRVPDPAVLRSLVGEALGAACAPNTVTVIDEVPIAPSGKPDKRRLTPR
jgi:fatty-acyl-CoA synthase